MSNRAKNVSAYCSKDYPDWDEFGLKEQSDLERLDRELGHEYIPMNVYVDLGTVIRQFQAPSICSRWSGAQQSDRTHIG